jgi:hypothetical protein
VASPRAAPVPSFGFATGSSQAGSGLAVTVPWLSRERRKELEITPGLAQAAAHRSRASTQWTPAFTTGAEPGDALAMLGNGALLTGMGPASSSASPPVTKPPESWRSLSPQEQRRAVVLSNPCNDIALLLPNKVPSELAGTSAGFRWRHQRPLQLRGSKKGGVGPATSTTARACDAAWLKDQEERTLESFQEALHALRRRAALMPATAAESLSSAVDTCEWEVKTLAANLATPARWANGDGPAGANRCTAALAQAKEELAGSLQTAAAAALSAELDEVINTLPMAESVINDIRGRFLAMKRSDDTYLGFIVRGDATGRAQASVGSPISGGLGVAVAGGFRPIDKRLLLRGEIKGGLNERLEGERTGLDELSVTGRGAAGWSAADGVLFDRRWLFGLDGGYAWDDAPDVRLGVHASARVALGSANYISVSARQAIIEDGAVTDLRGETTVSAEWNILPALIGWTDGLTP